ncbi:GAF domain-containing protein [Amnibacterium endophyticum]|uniref:GAF domain-containing protein n=1 Tax=Amnibacterium endophyticum TaxID=2109337 RepID=A0ABW4LFX5_9MICO
MTIPDLLIPIAARWVRRVQRELDLVPTPLDSPRRSVAGLRADRVLLIGNGPVIGFGVRTQALALPGHLSRRLATTTGRGAVVDVVAERGLLVDRVPRLLREHRLSESDAVVLSVGATDAAALTPVDRWTADLERALDELLAAASAGTVVVVLPVVPLQRTRGTEGPRRLLSDRHAATLDRATRDVCARRGDVVLLEPAPDERAPRTSGDYAALAARLAATLAPRLDALAVADSPSTARRRRRAPDPELLRQQAVDASGLAGSGSNAVLERLLQQAQDVFGAQAAAVTLVDGDDVVYKAAAGLDRRSAPRDIAPCNRAIRQEGPYVVPDLAGQPLADDGWRFYAGHPLEAPNGYRIGTLCVLGRTPRPDDLSALEQVALIDLAARAEAELWRQIEEGAEGATVQREVPAPGAPTPAALSRG